MVGWVLTGAKPFSVGSEAMVPPVPMRRIRLSETGIFVLRISVVQVGSGKWERSNVVLCRIGFTEADLELV